MQSDSRRQRAVAAGRGLIALVQAEQVTFLAAGIAYYAFVSLVPSLMLLLVVASAIGGEDLAAAVLDRSGQVLSPVGRDLLRDALVGASGRAPATLVSVLLLTWSTLKVFRGLDVAFSRIYGTPAAESFLGGIRDAAAALGGVGLGLLAVVAVSAAVSYSGLVFADVLGTVALVAVLAVTFFPLFYLFPDADVSARAVLPGTLLAAAGWAALGTLFRLYAERAGQFDLYGVLGVVLLLVTWYYVGSLTILLGAAFNAVVAGRGAETTNYNSPQADT